MVDAAGALKRALLRRLFVDVEAAATGAPGFPAVLVDRLELERLEQGAACLGRGAVGADGVEAAQRQLGRDLGVVGDQRLVGDLDHGELVGEPLGVGKAQPAPGALGGDAVGAEPPLPEIERRVRGDPPDDPVHVTVARPPGRHAGELEEGEVGAGAAVLVGEEEVVDGRVVLVDGLLHQAQAHHPGVEVDVALRVRRDRGDVVNSLQLHMLTYSITPMSRGRRRLVRVLIVLGSLLAFLSVFAIWTERQALDTGEWVNTSGRLIQNPKIREAVSKYLVDQLYENVDVEKELSEKLPGDTKELAGPISGGLRQVAGSGAEKVLESSTAQELWKSANRTTHEQLLEVLEEKEGTLATEEGKVSLNLGSLATNIADQVGISANLEAAPARSRSCAPTS